MVQYGMLSGKIDTLISLPYSFNIALATALVPGVAGYMASGKKEYAEKRISFSILITILIGLPCAAIMCIFSKQILQILFPNASAGSLMLSISSLGIIFVVMMQTINGALQGMGKVVMPVVALGVRNSYKIYIKYNPNTNRKIGDKWSNNFFYNK